MAVIDKFSPRIALVSVAIGLALAAGLVYQLTATNSGKDSSARGVVAQIHGVSGSFSDVRESEIIGLVSQGIGRADAIDRAVTRAVLAADAKAVYGQATEAAIVDAAREVAARVWLSKKSEEFAIAIKDEDVRATYEKEVRDENFTRYVVKYYLTQDPEDAQSIFTGASAGDKVSLDKFTLLGKTDNPGVFLREIPYGMGRLVRTTKEGDVLAPVLVRDGSFIMQVVKIVPGARPAFEKIKMEIKNELVARRLGEAISELRKRSRIELRG